MKILRAEHLGMCFGVRDAIALAQRHSQISPLTVLGELVHNETVLNGLRSQGVAIENDVDQVRTKTVMVTAHGASKRRISDLESRGLNVLEATCPLVHAAHHALTGLVEEGFVPIIIGKRDHVEVRGMTEDLGEFYVVLTVAEIEKLPTRERFGVVAQTTQPIQKVEELVAAIRSRFSSSEVRFVDTVCRPTKQRQSAAVDLARNCSAVVIIGGANSNNTRELVATCRRYCPRVHHVQSPTDLRREWLRPYDTVGITAGTSTPDSLIDEVEKALRGFARSSSLGSYAGNDAVVASRSTEEVLRG
jgi:4-hydroxy-3-methylbut-2-enyl diphosphate reductase